MANIISLEASPQQAFDRAEAALRAEGAVALPTDTVYGLAALASSRAGVARLFELKQRPAAMPIATLVADEAQALELVADLPEAAGQLMRQFWPGPLTLVLPLRPSLLEVYAGLGSAADGTIGVRCPAAEWLNRLAQAVGPIAATSANLHDGSVCETAADIADLFGSSEADAGLDLVVDGGRLETVASTVVRWLDGQLAVLRQGPITEAQLRQALSPLN